MLMMLPRDALTISGKTARVMRIGARTFTLEISSHIWSFTLKGSANVMNPALFTKTSMRSPQPERRFDDPRRGVIGGDIGRDCGSLPADRPHLLGRLLEALGIAAD